MLDQSFSADNFRKILDIENRKGNHVEDKLSILRVRRINESIRDCNQQIRSCKLNKEYEKIENIKDQKKRLRERKEVVLTEELEKISEIVTSKGYRFKLKKIDLTFKKPIYTVKNKPEYYFASKQLQKNISTLYGVKQSDRFSIVEQIILLLEDQFPKIILRTDIKDFYESLQHDQIQSRIIEDNILSPFSKRILKQILYSYKELSGNTKGVPRGVGVSAYLAELFMRDIDSEIKALDNVTYYSRFVDDIFIIFTPKPSEGKRDYCVEVKKIIENRYRLKINPHKTNLIDLSIIDRSHNLEYLGYNFSFGNGNVKVSLTSKKINKYKTRIKKVFDTYVQSCKYNEKKARKLLVKRIRFLCGNTKLMNNKKNILIGIYYSNQQLTEYEDLEKLDNSLAGHIRLKIKNQNLKNRLEKYSFKKGYLEKRFSPFSVSDLKEIMSIWKNGM